MFLLRCEGRGEFYLFIFFFIMLERKKLSLSLMLYLSIRLPLLLTADLYIQMNLPLSNMSYHPLFLAVFPFGLYNNQTNQHNHPMCRIILSRQPDLFPAPEKKHDISCHNTYRSGQSSIKSTGSQRSKYVANSKLTKSTLFSAIRGKRNSMREGLEERGLEMELLEDTLKLAEREEERLLHMLKAGMKGWRDECRKVLRGLEHCNV